MPNFVSDPRWLKLAVLPQICQLAANAYTAAKVCKDEITANNSVSANVVVELRRNHLRMGKFIKFIRATYAAELGPLASDQFRLYKLAKGEIQSGDTYNVSSDLNEMITALEGTAAQAKAMIDAAAKLEQSTPGTDNTDTGSEIYVWSRSSVPAFGEQNAAAVDALEAACDAVLRAIADPTDGPLPTVR